MAFSKARRLSDLISATGEVAAYADASIVPADLHSTLDLTGKTITVANTSTGDSDTTVANTAFVQQEIAALVASAPGTLNTLNELAAALGDDASFSTTVTDSIATKLPLAGGTLTGNLNIAGGAADMALTVRNSASGTSSSDGLSITVENPTPDVAIRQRENANMKFLTNNAERFRIASSGQLGIGGANYGTDGQVLTSTGSGSAPTFQANTGVSTGKAIAMAIVFG